MDPKTALLSVMAWPELAVVDVLALARVCAFKASEVIIAQGEQRLSTFLLLAGAARAQHLTTDGRLVRLHDYGPGDIFGALAALPAAEPAEVSAISEVCTALLRSGDFLALMERHACIGVSLSQSLLAHLHAMTVSMITRTTLSAAGRVHAELLRLADQQGRIAPPPVLSEIAAAVDTTRETASRTVAALDRRGIIRRDPDALVIVASARLQEMVI